MIAKTTTTEEKIKGGTRGKKKTDNPRLAFHTGRENKHLKIDIQKHNEG